MIKKGIINLSVSIKNNSNYMVEYIHFSTGNDYLDQVRSK